MTVLVTGASGYVGDRLCRALLKRGHAVRALVRRTSDVSSLPSPSSSSGVDFQLAYGDITDYLSVVNAMNGCTAVFHAAAITDQWLPDSSMFFSINVEGLKNVLRAARETETVEKIICTLSASALGPTDGYVGDENTLHNQTRFCSEYERSQVQALEVAMQAAAQGAPIVVVYLCVVYGPGKLTNGNLLAHLLAERFSGRLLGYVGSSRCKYFSFGHVEDVVDGHIAAMERGRLGDTYLLTGENASLLQVFDIAATITGTKITNMMSLPWWIFMALGWLMVVYFRITGKPPLVTPPMVRTLSHQWAFSCEKAKRELGYNPRSLKDGLLEVLPWLKSLGLLKY